MRSLSSVSFRMLLVFGLTAGFSAMGQGKSKSELPPEIRKEYTHTPIKPDPRVAKLFPAGKWVSFFNGKDLTGWAITDFAGGGEIEADKKFKPKKGKSAPALMLPMGEFLTGVTFTNPLPRTNYEVELDVMKVDGNDFFCGLTFPVGETHASLIMGGWGGAVVGISSLDGSDASENDTTDYIRFDTEIWYKVLLRVTPKKIETWLDGDKLIDQEIEGRRVHMRFGEIELSAPFGLCSFQTTTAYKTIRVRTLPAKK
ncbi:MAG: 3-keto-disaccharide hydrolase [Verrucomicrobiia bacterium]|jgi:hypothetical protein